MFTVFGATGNTGHVVAERLLAAGKKVRIVVRDAAKGAALAAKGAEVMTGDVDDAALVARALAGAEGAYLLLPPAVSDNDVLGKNRKINQNFAAGLTAAKVPHAAYLSSVGGQNATGNGPIAANHDGEVALANLPHTKLTFVRAAYFMENILTNAHPMKADGVLPVFGGGEQYPFPMIASHDIGDTAADALLAPPAQTQWIELRGPRDYSMIDAAAIASEILGRKVTATVLPMDQLVPTLMKFGFSHNMADLYREMLEGFAKGLTFEGQGKAKAVTGKTELKTVLQRGLA